MLCLTRKLNDVILLNAGTENEVEITVVNISKGIVKVGIHAPPHIKIIRKEIMHKKSTRIQPIFTPPLKSNAHAPVQYADEFTEVSEPPLKSVQERRNKRRSHKSTKCKQEGCFKWRQFN